MTDQDYRDDQVTTEITTGPEANRGGGGSATSGGFRGRGPRGYERSSDRIREDVCEWLTDDDEVDASNIEVQVERGVVILGGSVPDRGQKRRAEDIAERARGVRDVRNQLEIGDDMVGDLSQRAGRTSRGEELGAFRDPKWAQQDLRGFDVEARDGKIGTVDDRSEVGSDHLVVDTGTWIFGKKVVLPVGLVERISFEEHRLLVSRSKDEIKNAPDFDEELADDPRYGEELRRYYGGERDRQASYR
jgi:BON domain